MSLSRKRRRELKKLQNLAQAVLEEQREVIGHAGQVLGEAGYQARRLSDEHLRPRVANAYATVRPGLQGAFNSLKRVTLGARDVVSPYTTAAAQRAIAALEAADRKELAKQIAKIGAQSGLLVVKKKKNRFGVVLAVATGVAAAAAVGYSLFQAFRDDEDVWVAPESE